MRVKDGSCLTSTSAESGEQKICAEYLVKRGRQSPQLEYIGSNTIRIEDLHEQRQVKWLGCFCRMDEEWLPRKVKF